MKRSTKKTSKRGQVVWPTLGGCTLALTLLLGAIQLFNHRSPTPTPSATRQENERECDRGDFAPTRVPIAVLGDSASQSPVAQRQVGTRWTVPNNLPAKTAAPFSSVEARALRMASAPDELASYSAFIDGTPHADEILDAANLDRQLMRGLSAKQKVYLIMALDRADPHGNRMALLSAQLARKYDGAIRLPLRNTPPAVPTLESLKLRFGRHSISPPRREQLRRLLPYFADGKYGSPFSLYGEWCERSPRETAVELLDTSFEAAVEGKVANWTRSEQEDFVKHLYSRAEPDYESLRFDPAFQKLRTTPKRHSPLRLRRVRVPRALKSGSFRKLIRVFRMIP